MCLDETSKQLVAETRQPCPPSRGSRPATTTSTSATAPAEARRLVERFEWHYTPKHGSWLNLAESELAVLSGQ